MTACNAVIECRHKIAFVNTLPIEKLLPWPLLVRAFYFRFCSHLYFDLFFRRSFLFKAECLLLAPTDDCNLYSSAPLDPPDRKKKKNLQAVNESSSMPGAKGDYKLTEAFVMAPFSSSLAPLLYVNFPPSTCLLHAPAAPRQEQPRLHSLSARFMFRISRLMRTKEINWWFRPNETSVKINRPRQWKQIKSFGVLLGSIILTKLLTQWWIAGQERPSVLF